jgi:hypothetical protein
MNRSSTRLWIGIAGAALLVGFFLPWLDTGFGSASGLQIVRGTTGASLWRFMMLLAPAGGLAMIAFALGDRWKAARMTSLVTGAALVVYGAVQTVRLFFGVTGIGLWLVIGGAAAAALVPLLTSERAGV